MEKKNGTSEIPRVAQADFAALGGVELPAFLTVEEAARELRIGRTSAYALAARFEETDGADGLPVVRVGRLLRVPRARLEMLAGGPLTGRPLGSAPSPTSATDDVDGVQLSFPSTAA